ncbi:hypothetical protein AB0K48_40140 [Nonomuraea sp. NPDC055795]
MLVDLTHIPFDRLATVPDEVLRESLARHMATDPARWDRGDNAVLDQLGP